MSVITGSNKNKVNASPYWFRGGQYIRPLQENCWDKMHVKMAMVGLSEATVHVITTLGSVNLEYFFGEFLVTLRVFTAPNESGIHERQYVGTV
ncbi:hypothetical protein FQA39_LY05611 [Lamprigera yunnana]|nr:hypothetical protein FQA39_LY05611 [Lamprigera yunnana]